MNAPRPRDGLATRLGSPKLFKAMGCLGLTAGILGFVAVRSGPRTGEVIVHVTEPGVTIRIGDLTVRVEDVPNAPYELELPVGGHALVVSRDDRELYREEFQVRSGQSVILTAYDPTRMGRQSSGLDPSREEHVPATNR